MRNGYVACGRLNIVVLGTVVSTSTCPLPYKIKPDIKSSGVGTPKAGVVRLTQERQLYQYHNSQTSNHPLSIPTNLLLLFLPANCRSWVCSRSLCELVRNDAE